MAKMLRPGRSMSAAMRVFRALRPVHQVAWAAAAAKHGLATFLREPRSLEEVMQHLGAPPEREPVVGAFLRHGCLLKEIRETSGRYAVRGGLSAVAGDPEEDQLAALVEGLACIHHDGIYHALDELKAQRTLADIDHGVVARISELSAPLVDELIESRMPTSGEVRVLEIGCGRGRYLRHALSRNGEARGVGLELDPNVAETAREQSAGLGDRVSIVSADVREFETQERFELIGMFNLIYYLPVAERQDLIERVGGWLAPGGTLIISSLCQGGTIGANVLDLWFSSLRECGPMPSSEEVVGYLEATGLQVESAGRAAPGEAYFNFVARRPADG